MKTDLRLPTRFIFDTVLAVVVVAGDQVRFVNTANAAADVAALSVAFVGPLDEVVVVVIDAVVARVVSVEATAVEVST